ncbi:MAG: sugar kinase [Planctomycetes bacterium]|nr:sugar kinase [Planctomycetota bacterium]
MNRVVTFGEIMLRLSPPGQQRFVQAASFDVHFGGGEANVAACLAGLGGPASFVTRLPAGPIGDAAIAYLRRFGVGTEAILRGGSRLGIYFLETGATQRGSVVIYDRAGSAFSEIDRGMVKWEEALRGSGWLHVTGITPAVSRGAAAAALEAVEEARAAGLKVSCDLNYRAKLWKWGREAREVMPELAERCDILLGNEEDADKVFGIKAPHTDVGKGQISAAGYEKVAEQLLARFPRLQGVALTLRTSLGASHNRWSAVFHDRKDFRVAREHDIIPIIDRVGAGDAFAAGLIYGLNRWPDEPQRTLEFAAASGCLKHSVPGDFNLASLEEVEKLARGEASGRVAR